MCDRRSSDIQFFNGRSWYIIERRRNDFNPRSCGKKGTGGRRNEGYGGSDKWFWPHNDGIEMGGRQRWQEVQQGLRGEVPQVSVLEDDERATNRRFRQVRGDASGLRRRNAKLEEGMAGRVSNVAKCSHLPR